SAVREVEALITLVPLSGTLEVEAEVRAEDIGRIREGNTVRVKVTAYPFQKYGTLNGEVRVISSDAFQREGDRGGTFYRARIAITGAEDRARAFKDRLVPGMETISEIHVGKRRIIEYLTHPIIKSLDEAIREP
ncbi:MAG: HlyD family efflux transporter periplasmic adaptor subunit, partial [Mailhella sp.]|nr:HlyD family efflux transporter periplasmic adaptor subunit [Mailhella sp.]